MNSFNHTISDPSSNYILGYLTVQAGDSHMQSRGNTGQQSIPLLKSSTKVCFPDQKWVYYPAIKDPKLLQKCLYISCSRKRTCHAWGVGKRGCSLCTTHPGCIYQTLQPDSCCSWAALRRGASGALCIPVQVRHWWAADFSHTEDENPATSCTTEVKPLRYRFYLSSRTGNRISQVNKETSRATSAPPITLQNITKALPRVFNNPAALG